MIKTGAYLVECLVYGNHSSIVKYLRVRKEHSIIEELAVSFSESAILANIRQGRKTNKLVYPIEIGLEHAHFFFFHHLNMPKTC
jgi:hypothetical protein